MRPAVFTIPSHLPFLDALVAGLRAEVGEDPLALPRATILLPTRRAVRALREAFLRSSEGQALLLPRMIPVGDVDEDEVGLGGGEGGPEAAELAPAIPEARRRLLLARLILAWGHDRGTGPLRPGQAVTLAGELARFLDEAVTAGADFAELERLVPADYAEHWQSILRFLAIVVSHWPRVLAEEGCQDVAERRAAVLAARVAAWRRAPPTQRIVAAGLTGGSPGLHDLLATVARLPRGALVLPGLAQGLDRESWTAIAEDAAHPQHLLARLLETLELPPDQVPLWPAPGVRAGHPGRAALAAEILRPAAVTHRWRHGAALDPAAFAGFSRVECPGPQEEAGTIALLLRERLEQPGQTAALVTPDRTLARRVAADLRRWGIEIDDSAGVPLNRTPPGVFLRLIVDLAATRLAPLPLLAALKHPLTGCGWAPEALRGAARRLEMAVLRGPRPAPGIAGLRSALGRQERGLASLVDRLVRDLAPFLDALQADRIALRALLAAHLAAAEALATTAEESGAARLWREEAGEAAARFVAELVAAADDFPVLRGEDYPALFEALLAGPVARPAYGRHPRLAIWGLLEARLQHADLIILGGLNEGIWPAETASDPWLSRPMRRAFGLPAPEQQVGIAAHDFAQALGAGTVVLTRATRAGGAPTVPSRWLLRLDAVMAGAGLALRSIAAPSVLAWQDLLDRPHQRIDIAPPAPCPPVAVRPRRLSVTEIETWMRDPYAIYAKHVLGLRPLDPLDADPGAAERGQLIHSALDRFVREHPKSLPTDALERLAAIGRDVFGQALSRPGVWAFWWPRFERIAHWFVGIEMKRRAGLAESHAEIRGHLALDAPFGPFELICRADRVDRRRDGGLVIIDYKTGLVPTRGEVALGLAAQLPLEGAIAEAGGLAGLPKTAVVELAHWRLTGGDPAGEELPLKADAGGLGGLIGEALAGITALVAAFDRPDTPYRAQPRPEHAPRFTDYAHLARVKEWSTAAMGA